MPNSLLVVNMRGTVNVRTPVKKTLQQLKLFRRYSATLVLDSPSYTGMLNSAKEHLTWAPVDSAFVLKLIESRGRVKGWKPISKVDLKTAGYRSLKSLAKTLAEGKVKISEIRGLKPFFRLSPPRGGFKRSTRRMYRDGGVLGENPDLLSIVEKML